jgi:hypothetical protein
MAKKTFKIGEYAIGGIIQVCTTSDSVTIDALDWNSKQKIMGREFQVRATNVTNEMDNYLNELTSSYYADKVLDFIKENVTFNLNYQF